MLTRHHYHQNGTIPKERQGDLDDRDRVWAFLKNKDVTTQHRYHFAEARTFSDYWRASHAPGENLPKGPEQLAFILSDFDKFRHWIDAEYIPARNKEVREYYQRWYPNQVPEWAKETP